MELRPLPSPFPATTPMPRSSRIPTSHWGSNMLAPSRTMPGFHLFDHSSQIRERADPPPPIPSERISRRSGREPLPMHTLATVRRCQAARSGTPTSTARCRQPTSFDSGTPSRNRISPPDRGHARRKTRFRQAAKHQSPGDPPDQPPAKRRGPERRPGRRGDHASSPETRRTRRLKRRSP